MSETNLNETLPPKNVFHRPIGHEGSGGKQSTCGSKTACRRNGRYADIGETMDLQGTSFTVTKVYQQSLGDLTPEHAKQEGHETVEEYRDSILAMHPGMPWLPQMKVWVHEFQKLNNERTVWILGSTRFILIHSLIERMVRLSWYIVLLYLHIFSVVLSIGPYIVLFPLLALIRKAPFEQLPDYLEPFRITVRLTKHAGHVLVATGIILTWITAWTWKTSWIIATVLIMVASLYFIARAFSPLLRQLKAPHEDRDLIVNKLRNALIWYVIITLSMMWFMVAKPSIW